MADSTMLSATSQEEESFELVEKRGDHSTNLTASEPKAPTDGCGRRYTSSVFSLSVSAAKRPFSAHQSVLSQSPVLAVRCKSGFKESDIKHIDLPEDNVDVVGRLLEYLYTGDYGSSSIATNDFANELASMYIIAEKYQVEQLKTLIIKKLQTVDWLSTPPATFFLVSQRIYAGTPDSDVPFREFFAKEAPLRTVTIGSVGFDDVFGVMSLGGSFAADCFKAQHRALVNAKARYKLSHQTVTTLEIMLKQSEQIGSASVTKQTMVEQRLNVLQARCENVEKLRKRCDADQVEHGVSLQKLRSDHEKWHLNCTHCG